MSAPARPSEWRSNTVLSHPLLGALLWGLLASSVMLLPIALWLRSWHILLLAAVCALPFCILSIIGLFVLPLPMLELALAVLLWRQSHPPL